MNNIITKKSNFVEWRIKQGLTSGSIAQKAGVHYATMYRFENGKSISPTTAKKICDALGVEFDDLFEIVEKEKRGE